MQMQSESFLLYRIVNGNVMAMKKMLTLILAILFVQTQAGTVDTSDIESLDMFSPEAVSGSPNTHAAGTQGQHHNVNFDVTRHKRLLEFPERIDVVSSPSWIVFHYATEAKSLDSKKRCGKKLASSAIRD